MVACFTNTGLRSHLTQTVIYILYLLMNDLSLKKNKNFSQKYYLIIVCTSHMYYEMLFLRCFLIFNFIFIFSRTSFVYGFYFSNTDQLIVQITELGTHCSFEKNCDMLKYWQIVVMKYM